MWWHQHRPPPLIEDWSGPLVRRESGPAETHAGLTGASHAVSGPDVVEPDSSCAPGGFIAADLPAVRCLLVTCALDVGGMDEVVAFLARRLPGHGIETAVLHARPDPSTSGEPTGRLGRMLRSSGIDVHEASEADASEWIERWHPDVISSHGSPSELDWVLDIAERIEVPYVDTLHGGHEMIAADWSEVAARGSRLAAVVAVCELLRQQYLAGNPEFPPERIVAISNGIDDERRSSGDRTLSRRRLGLEGEYLFVSLARYCLQKNTYALLGAFSDVARRRPEAHLVIAGRPDDIPYYRQTARLRATLPCRAQIHLRDHVAAPGQLLAAADGFVLDSFFEGGPLVSMEAMFAGVPVVLSDVGAAREQVGGDPGRGYLVSNPLGDPTGLDWESMGAMRYRRQGNRDEFATAMEQLIVSRDAYSANRESLAAESAERFSADTCLAQHAALLRAVAAGDELPGGSATRGTIGT
jgi:glycosyltransferase involved in cell wall biosynthesis